MQPVGRGGAIAKRAPLRRAGRRGCQLMLPLDHLLQLSALRRQRLGERLDGSRGALVGVDDAAGSTARAQICHGSGSRRGSPVGSRTTAGGGKGARAE
jgi:hypothetical protein